LLQDEKIGHQIQSISNDQIGSKEVLVKDHQKPVYSLLPNEWKKEIICAAENQKL